MAALKRARRSAMADANISEGRKPMAPQSLSDHRYSTKAGATPKHRKSARLSNSAPKREVARSKRARRPSSPSIMPETAMAMTAPPKWPSMAMRMAERPTHRPTSVIRLGSILLKLWPVSRGRRGGRLRRRSGAAASFMPGSGAVRQARFLRRSCAGRGRQGGACRGGDRYRCGCRSG